MLFTGLTDMLKRRLFLRQNVEQYSGYFVLVIGWFAAFLPLYISAIMAEYRFFMLAGVAFGGIFANFVLNRLLFLVKRCKISFI